MKYKVTLNNRVYEVEVEQGEAMLVDEYELAAPAAPAGVQGFFTGRPTARGRGLLFEGEGAALFPKARRALEGRRERGRAYGKVGR